MSVKNKKILVIMSKDVMRRNILDTSFWSNFVGSHGNLEIVLLIENGKKKEYETKFGATNVTIEETQKEKVSFWHNIVLFLVRTGTNAHGVKLYRWRAYTLKQTSFFMTVIKAIIANTLAPFTWYKSFVRTLYQKLELRWISNLYERHQPDLVFAPSLIDINIDALVAVEARRRGIRVVGMVRSWDNLAIHGLLPFVPDRFILQNRWLEESARLYQGLDTSRIEHDVIGLPHYDSYREPLVGIKNRNEFFASMGLDPQKKLILLGGFDFYFSEDTLPTKLNAAIESGHITASAQVVFRPHPKTPFQIADYKLDALEHVILNDAFSDKKNLFSDADTFNNLVYHCDVLINVASTLAIDGAVFDKPVVCVDFDDAEKNIPEWKSVHKLFTTFDHYEKLVATGGVRLPKSEEELINDINEYIDDPSLDGAGRKNIIDEFVAPFDGKAGQRLSMILSDEVKKLNQSV